MKRLLACFLVFFLLFICTGCDPTAAFNNYPSGKASRWICDNPKLEILYIADKHGIMQPQIYQMEWEGEQIPVSVAFGGGYYSLVLDNGDGVVQPEEILATGTWHYRWGKLVLEIVTDNFFDGEYKELVFIRGE